MWFPYQLHGSETTLDPRPGNFGHFFFHLQKHHFWAFWEFLKFRIFVYFLKIKIIIFWKYSRSTNIFLVALNHLVTLIGGKVEYRCDIFCVYLIIWWLRNPLSCRSRFQKADRVLLEKKRSPPCHNGVPRHSARRCGALICDTLGRNWIE